MNSKIILVIGDQRSGKTFFTEQLLRSIVGNTNKIGLVYNKGVKKDFGEGFTLIDFCENPQNGHIEKFTLFNDDREVNISFLREAKESLFCSYRMSNTLEQDKLFRSFLYFLGGFVFVIDDSIYLFRQGVQSGFLEMLTRMNHCGIKSSDGYEGSDIILIFHHPDHVPTKIWDACTDIFFFYTKRGREEKTSNKEIDRIIDEAQKDLSEIAIKRKLTPENIYTAGFFEIDLYNLKKVYRNSEFYKSFS